MPKQLTQFFLARHGETEWNKIRRLQGQLNSKLTDVGVLQAENLASNLKDNNIQLIVTSPLERAFLTAQICANILQLDVKTHDSLVERDFGLWQSCFFDELTTHENFSAVFSQVTHDAPPEGESGLACAHRIKTSLEQLAKVFSEKNIMVVTHGDAIRCFLGALSASSECDAYSQYGNGNVFQVNYQHANDQFIVVSDREIEC